MYILLFMLLMAPAGAISDTGNGNNLITTNPSRDLVVCEKNINIRNDLTTIRKELENCDIVDGYITLALISQSYNGQPIQPEDWANITFPRLREITNHLILFRVQHLTSLNTLFPNLAVIRGINVIHDYSFIIYEMMQLQEINLPNLNDILSGSVRIERNPNLCFFDTINWDRICKNRFAPHFIKDNKATCSVECPSHCATWPREAAVMDPIEGAVTKRIRDRFCYNAHTCQDPNLQCSNSSYLLPAKNSTGCCSPQCAGGCYEANRSDSCISCRNVLQEGKCVETCDKLLFLYKGTCLAEHDCIKKRVAIQSDDVCETSPMIQDNFKAISIPGETGQCTTKCPPNFEEDPLHKDKCRPCENNKCKIVCKIDSPITHLDSLKQFIGEGCNVLNGTLDIQLKQGKNVVDKLREAFSGVEEIIGYLRITRSPSLVTLDFFENLKYIRGSTLERNRYSFVILENQGLQDLFPSFEKRNQKLELTAGTVFAHLNPRLCPQKIENLKNYTKVADWDDKDVSTHSNGEKEACQNDRLDVQYKFSTPKLTVITFDNYAKRMEDPRQLLYYVIFYREAQGKNVSMYEDRDACGGNDPWKTVQEQVHSEKRDKDAVTTSILTLPATRYALYVRTFTVQSSHGAISPIIYFETVPDTPGIPRDVFANPTSPSNITISWMPPSKPNGRIDHYLIKISKVIDHELTEPDLCREEADTVKKPIMKDETIKQTTSESTKNSTSAQSVPSSDISQTCDCSATPHGDDGDSDLRVEQVTFQDSMINLLYLRKCPEPASSPEAGHRTRRSASAMYDIEHRGNTGPVILRDRPNLSAENLKLSFIDSGDLNSAGNAELGSLSSVMQISVDSYPPDTPSSSPVVRTVEFNPQDDSMTFTVHSKNLEYLHGFTLNVIGLKHYTSYSFEVQACHDGHYQPLTKTSSYERCGVKGIGVERTLANSTADAIDPKSIKLDVISNSTNNKVIPAISWDWPPDPNGRILGALIQLTGENAQKPIVSCISKTSYDLHGSYTPESLGEGRYIVKIVVVTSSGLKTGTVALEYLVVPSGSQSYSLYIFWGVIFILVVAAGILAIFVFTLKKRSMFEGVIYASVNPDYMQYTPDGWEVDKDNLTILQKIGNGSFGTVHKGLLKLEKGTLSCAVKTISSDSTARQRIEFLNEASTMKQFDTHHVVKLLGVVSTSSPAYVIMEFMENGDLRSYIRGIRSEYEKKNTLYERIYLTAAQIADGMAYLASKKFVHRDLAARNCMVAEDFTVKIGDFGLTRDIYDTDYYRRGTHGRLPIRWMSPEAIKDNKYTTASDVWSYGIVIWEMATFCEHPYQGCSNEEVMSLVSSGRTIPRPANCPEKLLNIMNRCFRFKPEERPSFMEIIEYLMPETNNELSPHSYYYQVKNEEGLALLSNNTTANTRQSSPNESTTTRGASVESYPLLAWGNCSSPIVNGDVPPNGIIVNHVNEK
ncbi:Insulin receptor [Fragariocoptes setiger]|uniref:Tyrosine-protein kinase receptor n=1 Tax=Fragariocoptes setiger TaxID=1670756 RepID=A0ABQ7SCE6_9ACAR|nr:Insulin receptor [Fragariocoptes setiger]